MIRKKRMTLDCVVKGKGGHFRKVKVPYIPRRGQATSSLASHNELQNVHHGYGPMSLDIASTSVVQPLPCTLSGISANESSGRYRRAKENQSKNWTALREKLVNAFFESLAPSKNCDRCGLEISDVYQCSDCSPRTILCHDCIETVHLFQQFHVVHVWKGKAWVPFSLCKRVIASAVHQKCPQTYVKDLIVVDSKGRQHNGKFQFCACEEETTTLIRLHFWPSSPKNPKLCFDFHIMEMLRVLYLQVPVPVMDFCEALKFIFRPFVTTENLILQDIYKVLINESFEEYRYFVHQMDTLSTICPEISESLKECPACPQTNEYQRFISMDANFGLVRKKSSGSSVSKPKHQGLYFLDQTEVDKFVGSHKKSEAQKDVDCNEFKAGSNIRSKGRYQKLDETAVFGASCRHDFPQMMFSLKHGERLAYPVYLLQQLLSKYGTTNSYFLYDIACMLENHIKKHYPDVPIDDINIAIPIFHCYGHKVDCQVRYNPRKITGFGLTDGESLERLWSYLRNFSKITKEMTPSHRIDALTDALIHYSNRNYLKIGTFLCTKMDRAKDVLVTASEELSHLLSSMKVGVSEVRVYRLQERNRTSINQVISGKDKTLHVLHKHCTERKILLETMKKYAAGQAIAIKLAKNIGRTTKQIKKLLNTLTTEYDSTLTFKQVVEFEFLLEPDAKGFRRADDLLSLTERAEEEVSLLGKEMVNVGKVLHDLHGKCIEAIAVLPQDDISTPGKTNVIIRKIVGFENQFSALRHACRKHVNLDCTFQSFTQLLHCSFLSLDDIFSVEELDEIVSNLNTIEAEEEVNNEEEIEDCEDEEDHD